MAVTVEVAVAVGVEVSVGVAGESLQPARDIATTIMSRTADRTIIRFFMSALPSVAIALVNRYHRMMDKSL